MHMHKTCKTNTTHTCTHLNNICDEVEVTSSLEEDHHHGHQQGDLSHGVERGASNLHHAHSSTPGGGVWCVCVCGSKKNVGVE